MRQDHRLGDIPRDLDVGALRPKLGWIDLAPYGGNNVHWQLAQSCKNALEEITRLDVEHSAEREVDGRCAVQAHAPGRCSIVSRAVDREWADGVGCNRQREGRVAKTRRERRQDQVAA